MSGVPPVPPPPGSQGDPSGFQPFQQPVAGLTPDDTNHLSILSICWKVMTAFQAIAPCCLFGYFGLLTAGIGTAAASEGSAEGVGVGLVTGGVLMVVLIPVVLVLGGIAWLCWNASKCIDERRGYNWLLAASILAMLSGPLGIALGVFTLVVVNRPTVRAALGP